MSNKEIKKEDLQVNNDAQTEEIEQTSAEQETVKEKEVSKKDKNVNLKNKNSKKQKQAKPRSNKAKEIVSELKKVTWPKFPEVVKKTGVVLIVVAFFFVVLFGIDWLLSLLYKLLTKAM